METSQTPQLENGYTRIANELYESILLAGFTGRQLHAVLYVIRRTYGWNRKTAKITGGQLAAATGTKDNHARSVIRELKKMGIVYSLGEEIGINKNYFAGILNKKTVIARTGSVLLEDRICPSVGQDLSYQPDKNGPTLNKRKKINKKNIKQSEESEFLSKPAKDEPVQIIGYLNLKAGKKFQCTKTNLKFISARIQDGFTSDQIRSVIDLKCAEWLNDKKMNQYLRPATLFNDEKFNQYIGEIGKQQQEYRGNENYQKPLAAAECERQMRESIKKRFGSASYQAGDSPADGSGVGGDDGTQERDVVDAEFWRC